jgi:cyclopropane-fatty-acyl-phospholipid synthase
MTASPVETTPGPPDVPGPDVGAPSSSRPAAEALAPMLEALLGGIPPIRFEFWDGSTLGPTDDDRFVRVLSPDALRRIAWSPDELGFARAFVMGDLEVVGNLAEALHLVERTLPDQVRTGVAALPKAFVATRQIGAFGPPLPAPPEEIVPHGVRHSIRRDRTAVSHHYDVGNEFYELILGPAMTYSCARFADETTTLAEAQAAKHDLICRKLGLPERPGARVLDVGCGWGSMAIHAAREHGARVVGVTISREQAAAARRRVAEAGVDDLVEIRDQDYRLIDDGPFDAISSIGMAEHVGRRRMNTYFATLFALLTPGGRMLNHAISSVGGSRMGRRSFIGRYVFPDGELLDVADTIHSMQSEGFEVRDVENLREHYAITLRHWVANLEQHWDRAVELVGVRRARVWRLYMSASINRFEGAHIAIHQVLGVRCDPAGASGMPRTRVGWEPAG